MPSPAPETPRPLSALLLDFNAYFASVEQQLRPELRGRPVGILPVLAETTCCIAASYEAKRFGVKTGTSVLDARRLCPGIALIQARPAVYVEMHHRLMNVVDQVIAITEVLSIDEVVCELSGSWQRQEVAVQRALEVKRRIRAQVGECLTSSVGIGPNRFIAKMASNMRKPDGLTVIHAHELPQRLYGLKLADIHGVGRGMLARLAQSGIRSVQALCQADRASLRRIWGGVGGERMYDQLRGYAVPVPPTRRGSISHSHVLPPPLRFDQGAYAVLSKLLQKAARRMRGEGYLCRRLEVSVDWRERAPWVTEARFQAMDGTLGLLRILDTLWAERPRGREPVKVGLVLKELAPTGQSALPLFPEQRGVPGLDAVLDRLHQRFGSDAIYFGGAFRARHEAPMRISFTHIPDLDLEGDALPG
ncbi:MAG TPA: DNA polymerase [Thiobacillaceae bacterium]|nr:DNA polymerase [Thiobacillaceae bacterium]HNU65391.1 DNA polymerase [Thiobacillaceae bacterium]